MILQCCINCEYHRIKDQDGENVSHCAKENCWSRYSKCVTLKALDRFLDKETVAQRQYSALARVYSSEE
jgi:hypothetical protein